MAKLAGESGYQYGLVLGHGDLNVKGEYLAITLNVPAGVGRSGPPVVTSVLTKTASPSNAVSAWRVSEMTIRFCVTSTLVYVASAVRPALSTARTRKR